MRRRIRLQTRGPLRTSGLPRVSIARPRRVATTRSSQRAPRTREMALWISHHEAFRRTRMFGAPGCLAHQAYKILLAHQACDELCAGLARRGVTRNDGSTMIGTVRAIESGYAVLTRLARLTVASLLPRSRSSAGNTMTLNVIAASWQRRLNLVVVKIHRLSSFNRSLVLSTLLMVMALTQLLTLIFG